MGDNADRVKEALVRGGIIITNRVPPFTGATAHVYLEDVSRADGESVVLAETVIKNVSHKPSHNNVVGHPRENVAPMISFTLPVPPETVIDPGGNYAVRVWIDRDSDGKEGPGDLYSDERYRVLTHGGGSQVTITLGES
jgi:uncharacterized lipoprotein YbaY